MEAIPAEFGVAWMEPHVAVQHRREDGVADDDEVCSPILFFVFNSFVSGRHLDPCDW